MKVFVIIVTYNGADWLEKCIGGLKDSTIPLHVVVVDNASSDLTVDLIKKNYPSVILIESAANVGFGRANNIGIKYAVDHDADFVFLLNQDAWIKGNDAVQELVTAAQENPGFGIISPIHLNGEGSALDANFSEYVSERACSGFVSDFFIDSRSDRLYEVSFVNAAAWLLPTSAIKNYGSFDDVFFMYGEDVEYCSRLRYHGLKIGVTKKSFVHHARDRHFFKKTTVSKKIRQQFLWQKALCLMAYFDYQNEKSAFYILYKNFIESGKDILRLRVLALARFSGALSFVFGSPEYRTRRKGNKIEISSR